MGSGENLRKICAEPVAQECQGALPNYPLPVGTAESVVQSAHPRSVKKGVARDSLVEHRTSTEMSTAKIPFDAVKEYPQIV